MRCGSYTVTGHLNDEFDGFPRTQMKVDVGVLVAGECAIKVFAHLSADVAMQIKGGGNRRIWADQIANGQHQIAF